MNRPNRRVRNSSVVSLLPNPLTRVDLSVPLGRPDCPRPTPPLPSAGPPAAPTPLPGKP
jgi:hypothetical protein